MINFIREYQVALIVAIFSIALLGNAQAMQLSANSTALALEVTISHSMSCSASSQEVSQQIEAGNRLSINLNEYVVLRSDSKKILFSLLANRIADANGGFSSDNAMRVAGFDLPTKFRVVSSCLLLSGKQPQALFEPVRSWF